MKQIADNIKLIYIEKAVRHHPLVERFIHRFPLARTKYIDSYTNLPEANVPLKQKFTLGKKCLVLAEKRGSYIKKFYLHPSLRGNPIYLINHSIGCPYDCLYCYIQAYQSYPSFVQFVNLERIPAEVERILKQSLCKPLFFSSGILSDSLLFDELSGLCSSLFPLFASFKGVKLEIRSRTANISHLLKSDLPKDNIILTWSLSPEWVVKNYEPRTPPTNKRIEAAALCQRAGYKVGFHLDPLIHYSEWRQGYQALIDQLKRQLSADGIQYIFLGSLRFKGEWAKVFRIRFPKSRLLADEFVLSADGKYRYFKPIRLEMYYQIAGWLNDWSAHIPLYLAMEPPEVWYKWKQYRAERRNAKLFLKA